MGKELEEGKGGELDAREWVRWSQMSRGGGGGGNVSYSQIDSQESYDVFQWLHCYLAPADQEVAKYRKPVYFDRPNVS